MPNPNTLLPRGNWLGSIPWAETTPPPTGSSSTAAFSYGTGNMVRKSILVYFADTDAAILAIMGKNIPVAGLGTLSRTLPVRHEVYNWLYATAIQSVEHLQFKGQMTLNVIAPECNYTFSRITILFAQPRWVMLTDAQINSLYGGQEWYRFITIEENPIAQVISRKADAYAYIKTGNPAYDTYAGRPLPSSQNQTLLTKELTFTWRRVPQNGWKASNGAGQPINADSILNKVNNAVFLGYPAGTLLFKTYQTVELESPIDPLLTGVNISLAPGLLYDIRLTFLYFNPPVLPGYPGDGINAWTTAGHALQPAPGGDLYWYYATGASSATGAAAGSALGSAIVQPGNFATIFAMNS